MPASDFKNLETLANHIDDSRQSYVDNREWTESWGDRWVVYADLIAFASRAKRSEAVVLNNIVRFDRASTLAAEQFPQVQIRRFSDASFAIAERFCAGLGFAIAVAHTCLAFNMSFLRRGRKLHFHTSDCSKNHHGQRACAPRKR
ncbi:MAG: hypothetical protein AB7J63_01035 [Vicinamibacterales bacterium]